jgi:hypothetical protein
MSITASQIQPAIAVGDVAKGQSIKGSSDLAIVTAQPYGTAPDDWNGLLYAPSKAGSGALSPEFADKSVQTFTKDGVPINLLVMEANIAGPGAIDKIYSLVFDLANVTEANYGAFTKDFRARLRIVNKGANALRIFNMDLSTDLTLDEASENNANIDLHDVSAGNFVKPGGTQDTLHAWFKLETPGIVLEKHEWLDVQLEYLEEISANATVVGGFIARQMDAGKYLP